MSKPSAEVISSGIDELVARLRLDGVEAGHSEAARIIAEANQRAEQRLAEAEQQAAALLDETRARIAIERQAAEDALKLAYRDLVLEMKSHLLERLAGEVKRLTSAALDQEAVLEQLVVEALSHLCGQARLPRSGPVEMILPPQILGLDAIRQDPASASQGPMAELAFSLQADLLRDGVTFTPARAGGQKGIRLRLVDQQMEVDLTDGAISDLLLSYLQPRFRAILDGIIH